MSSSTDRGKAAIKAAATARQAGDRSGARTQQSRAAEARVAHVVRTGVDRKK